MGLPPNPHRGPPRALLNMQKYVVRGQHHRVELALLGSPRYEALRTLVAYRFSLVTSEGILFREVSWVNPTVTRHFVWEIPGRVTLTLPSVTIIHVEVCNLAGYTYSGTPIISEPFTRTAAPLRVLHTVAGGNLGRTPYPVL